MLEINLSLPQGLLLGLEWNQLFRMSRSGKTFYANPDAPKAGWIVTLHLILFALSLAYHDGNA